MKRLLLAVFLGAAVAGAVSQPSAAASPPRVLAIHFTADVNPVTQDWVNHQLQRAQNGGYAAAVIILDTSRRSSR
jgi:membrane-bound ClpP family serine protease